MEAHHQEILQTILEADEIKSSPRYKALILMSRQANERREYESYCNRIKLCTNKIEKIKEAFPANHGMTYEQFLKSRLEPQVEQNVASFVEKIEEKVEYETESVAEKKDDDNTNTPLILEETDFD
jgi:hypothetical protein